MLFKKSKEMKVAVLHEQEKQLSSKDKIKNECQKENVLAFDIYCDNLLIGFMIPGIDNFAHIGGLVGGYLLTMALGVPGKSKKSDQINGIIVLVLLVAFLSYMLFGYLR